MPYDKLLIATGSSPRQLADDAGDVASAYHPLLGRHIRVEHWANALKQPAVAAAAMLGKDGRPW